MGGNHLFLSWFFRMHRGLDGDNGRVTSVVQVNAAVI